MKIALINENSQAAKNGVIVETLKKVVEPLGHEVFNYGMYSADDAEQLTYVQIGILAAILLNSGAADLVITGCGTGEGACLACNAFPGVLCGHVVDPTDAYQFTQVNNAGVGVLSLTYNMCLKNCSLKNGAAVILKKEQFLNREMLKFLTKLKRLLTETFLIFFLTLTKTLLRVLLQVSNSKTCSSLTASAIRLPNTLRQSLINFALNRCATHTCFFADFYIATTPSLRDTSPQGEAFKRLPLRGAVNTVD